MQPRTPLKNQSFIYRYPRASVTVLTTAGLLIFFSRPIYDIFFRNIEPVDIKQLKQSHKSRFSKS